MAAYQVKVFYGLEFKRCGTFFISCNEYQDYNLKQLTKKVMEVTKMFSNLSCDQIRLRFLDDEGCYVNLEEELMQEFFRCARNVDGVDWKRITVQAETWNSPLPKPTIRQKQMENFESCASKLLSKDSQSVTCNYVVNERQEHGHEAYAQQERYLTPVERLIHSKENAIREQVLEIEKKNEEISALERSFSSAPINSTRPACSKCHLRTGHVRTNCPNNPCVSARFCGDIKRHPEEKKDVKSAKTDLQLLKSKLGRMKDELLSLRGNMESSKRTFSQKIYSDLVNSNKKRYLSPDGVVNWMAVNIDSKKIEKICNGVIPSPTEDLQALIAKHDSQQELACVRVPLHSKTKTVKELWEKKGVKFPGSGPHYWPPAAEKSSDVPVPHNSEEEEYQFQVAIRESQRKDESNCAVSPPLYSTYVSQPQGLRTLPSTLPQFYHPYPGIHDIAMFTEAPVNYFPNDLHGGGGAKRPLFPLNAMATSTTSSTTVQKDIQQSDGNQLDILVHAADLLSKE